MSHRVIVPKLRHRFLIRPRHSEPSLGAEDSPSWLCPLLSIGKPSCPAQSTSVQVTLGWIGGAGRNRRSADWGRDGDLRALHRGKEIRRNG